MNQKVDIQIGDMIVKWDSDEPDKVMFTGPAHDYDDRGEMPVFACGVDMEALRQLVVLIERYQRNGKMDG